MKTSLALCALISLVSCSTGPAQDELLPMWLTALIRQLESRPPANPPAFVAQYEYRGQTVYYLPPRCCDIESNLYDAVGRVICHPDGGFAGNGDGRCTDFFALRRNERIVWRDSRAYPGAHVHLTGRPSPINAGPCGAFRRRSSLADALTAWPSGSRPTTEVTVCG